MNLTIEQKKWLTEEFLGLCWHETVLLKQVDFSTPIYDNSIVCSCGWVGREGSSCAPNLDFTDWRTFGLLWEKMQEHERLAEFTDLHGKSNSFPVLGELSRDINQALINPTRFALAIYDFFNGGNDE